MDPTQELDATLALWDWRRRMYDLGGEVRALAAAGQHEEAWRRWRDGRDALFRDHPQSPLEPADREAFEGLPHFDYDPAFRVDAEVRPAEAATLRIAHSAEGETPFRRFGTARFELAGVAVRLSLYWLDAYGGGVFLPFRDATSGDETYGGGRYLLDTVKGADLGHDGRTVPLDLNLAYHPSCVYSSAWSCPLAPPENHLPLAVRAGERLRSAQRRAG